MNILYDKQEKMPWDFRFHGHEMKQVHLKTGDYSIEGLEELVVIERKRNTGELSQNLGSKSRPFFSEMERMQKIPNRYLIFEFSHEDLLSFPKNSGIPQKVISKIRINSAFLIKQIEKIENDFEISIIFCGNRVNAENKALEILERAYEQYN